MRIGGDYRVTLPHSKRTGSVAETGLSLEGSRALTAPLGFCCCPATRRGDR